jgi:hypothetical protein
MKIIKNLTFGALAVLAATLLFQTAITRADAHGQKGDHGQRGGNNERGDRDHCDAKITFTKFVTAVLNQPGLIATMTGAGEGDAGDVLFTGDVLKQSTLPPPVASWRCTTSLARNTPSPRSSMAFKQSPASARRA